MCFPWLGPPSAFFLQNTLVNIFDLCSLGQWLALRYQALGLLLCIGSYSFVLSRKILRDLGSSTVSLGMNLHALSGA
jgi:hypothetical protein